MEVIFTVTGVFSAVISTVSSSSEMLTSYCLSDKIYPVGAAISLTIHTGELRSFVYQGGYIISKDDLIDYLIEHSEDEPARSFKRGGSRE